MYKKYNAENVLAEVNKLIAELDEKKAKVPKYFSGKPRYRVKGYNMDDVYERLSIFDWWTNTLGYSKLVQMRSFLREAIKLGFTGYVCFKVGASGCANGMWASTEESTNGYSPDGGETLYRSFTPDYTYWSFTRNGEFLPCKETFDSVKTVKDLENLFYGRSVANA